MKNCYAEDIFKTSWKTRNVCWTSFDFIKLRKDFSGFTLQPFSQFKKMEDHELYITNFTLSVFQSCALLIKKRTNKSFRNSKFTAVANDVIQERN